MCGIKVDGKNHFVIAPKPGGTFKYAKASYQSVYGKVVSEWKKQDDGSYIYQITIPANTTATVKLPGKSTQVLETGVYKIDATDVTDTMCQAN